MLRKVCGLSLYENENTSSINEPINQNLIELFRKQSRGLSTYSQEEMTAYVKSKFKRRGRKAN